MSDDSAKAPRDQRRDSCLHCVLMIALEEWFKRYPKLSVDGKVIIDATDAIRKLIECLVDVINELPDRHNRRRAMRFAHDALDATMKAARTGKLIPVEIPAEH